jgi:2-polyprenyl-3-methyl-5-hydroxy-6-metoxy-1,4-benzoquinol methylase
MMTSRDVQPEMMDQPELSPDLHRTALAALGLINRLSRTESVVWEPIRQLALSERRPIRVLDVACGGGDVLRSLASRARLAGLPVEFSGCDVSGLALEFASERARKGGHDSINFFEHDVLRDVLPEGYDVILSTLFFHHLQVKDARTLLSEMARKAERMVLVDDLRRTRAGFLLAHCVGRLLTRSPVVQSDGPLSVRAAFTEAEWRDMAVSCELQGVTIQRHWPQRMLLKWERLQ